MNQIATVGERSLQPAQAGQSSVHIAKMFAVMMSAKGGDFTKAIASEYVEAVKSFPEWAIAEVSESYRHGKYGDGRFVPLPGEFAAAVRRIVEHEARRAHERRQRAEEIANRKRRERMLERRTPEQRERVRRAHDMWKSSYEALRAENEIAQTRKATQAEMMQKHDKLFEREWRYGGPEIWEKSE